MNSEPRPGLAELIARQPARPSLRDVIMGQQQPAPASSWRAEVVETTGPSQPAGTSPTAERPAIENPKNYVAAEDHLKTYKVEPQPRKRKK
jgi:hypothetical protein